MPVLQKLNNARVQFHSQTISKSGYNKFAGYTYFTLADFIVPALKIFSSLNLSAIVSFPDGGAEMVITDIDDNSSTVIKSPMSSAALKGCHEVQNLGAVQTYLRRYLWVLALDIVEHEALDFTIKQDVQDKVRETIAKSEKETIPQDRKHELDEVALYMIECSRSGDDIKAINVWYDDATFTGFDPNEERKYVWGALKSESKLRSAIKANKPEEQ